MCFYDVFIKLCNQKGVKPADVSRAIGIKEGVISGWKKRKSTPTSVNLQKVADYFGVTVDYFKKEELPDKAEQSAEDLAEINEMVSQISRLSDEERKIVDDLLAVLLAKHE